jgi:hypothetical protein
MKGYPLLKTLLFMLKLLALLKKLPILIKQPLCFSVCSVKLWGTLSNLSVKSKVLRREQPFIYEIISVRFEF